MQRHARIEVRQFVCRLILDLRRLSLAMSLVGVIDTSAVTDLETSMTNPLDDEDGEFCVLVNEEGQYSLWPTFKDVPAGWTPVGPRGRRKECLDYIDETWTDMRPRSLVEQMNKEAAERDQSSPN